jgi:hypothetical protein
MIVGWINGSPTPKQSIKAESAREAVELFQHAYPGYGVAKVWLLQEIAPEFWSHDVLPSEADEVTAADPTGEDLPKSRVVEIPAMVLGNRPTPELAKSRGAKWAARYAESGGHKDWHPIFTDGITSHYQFD